VENRTLSLRELNRATLARQLLLERASVPAISAIQQLGGLQAQLAVSPYIGLWTRMQGFQREELARAIETRGVVKATFIRATLHLVTAEDYRQFRMTLQPLLEGAAEAIKKQRGGVLDVETVIAKARKYIAEEPRTFAEITSTFSELMPGVDPGSIRYTIRTHLPLVQVPVENGWSYPGNPSFTLAETWLGKPISKADNLRLLVFRYLQAFGPASVTDMQTWSGFKKLKEVVEKLRPELTVYRDEQKRELFDIPDNPLPAADVPAPVRFLPEYDNLLLSHTKRTRIIAEEHRSRVYLPGLRVRSTFLIDGFVRGAWKIQSAKGTATLNIEPFEKLTKQNRSALVEEAEQLVRFVENGAKTFEVRFVD
jgi:Winged helix DNA-binding domain